MKIAIIDVNYGFTSTGNIVRQLKNASIKYDTDVHAFYGRGVYIKEHNLYKYGIDIETKFHAFMTRITGLTGYFSFFSTINLLRRLKKFKPDLIHIHEIHGYHVNWVSLIKFINKNNIKVVWTFHCDFMITGRCGMSNDCERWKSGCGKCPNLKTYPKTIVIDFSRFMALQKKTYLSKINNLIICTPSLWLKNKVKQSYLSNKQVLVVPNGIDTNVFSDSYDATFNSFDLQEKLTYMIFVAPNPLSEQKGGIFALRLAEELQTKGIFLVIVGSDIKKVSIEKNIINIPKVYDKKKLAKLYADAFLTVVTSKKETFSLVTAESLACGTPVIGFNSGGPEEIAIDNMGYFVRYGDYISLKKHIINMIDNNFKMATESTMRNHIIKNYSQDAMIEKYYNIYKGFFNV